MGVPGEEPRLQAGAAEVTRSVEGLFAFAATLPARLDRQFEILYDATIGDESVDGFLRRENPKAREAMAARFDEAMSSGRLEEASQTLANFKSAAPNDARHNDFMTRAWVADPLKAALARIPDFARVGPTPGPGKKR